MCVEEERKTSYSAVTVTATVRADDVLREIFVMPASCPCHLRRTRTTPREPTARKGKKDDQ